MAWLKDIYLDIIVFFLIVIFSITDLQALEIILWIYSGLLLFVKIMALFMPTLGKRAASTTAPNYIFHLIYFLVIVAFLYAQSYYLAGIWVIIWGASSYQAISKK